MHYDKTKDYQPFKYLEPVKRPTSGYLASTVHLITNDVNIGADECEFEFTREQLVSMDRGTLIFRAKDAGGGIDIKKCSVCGLKMVIKLDRRAVQFGKVQVEWHTINRLYSF